GVGTPEGGSQPSRERGEVYDRFAAAIAQEGKKSGDRTDNAQIVDLDQAAGEVRRVVGAGRQIQLAGTVEEDVESAFPLLKRARGVLQRGEVGDVQLEGIEKAVAEGCDGGGELLGASTGDPDPRAAI